MVLQSMGVVLNRGGFEFTDAEILSCIRWCICLPLTTESKEVLRRLVYAERHLVKKLNLRFWGSRYGKCTNTDCLM
jgi:hypothetical protein